MTCNYKRTTKDRFCTYGMDMEFTKLTAPAPSQLRLLLEEIKFQQQKELQQAALQDVAGFMSRGTTYWTDVFVRHFLFQTERAIDADDLLFFIRKKHVRGSLTLPKFQTDVEVFRNDSKKLPIGDPEIEWQETVFLNLLIHQLEYTLTLAVCTRTSPKELQVLKRHTQKVYASPSRRRMDTKGEVEEITYPYLSFMVDNFDEVYSEMTIRDGEMVCVELLAAERDGGFQAVLFLGSIRYDALKRVYDSRASLGSKMAQRMTFGLFSSSHSQRVEYVRLKGPYGKGHAEVAVSKPKGAGVETPTSEPGFCMTDGIWDSDVESDSEDFMFKHHRRLSDPSSNLTNYSRSGWRTGKTGGSSGETNTNRARSQNEGLDYCGLAEIEAGDVRDDRRGDDNVSCCGCCGCECMLTQSKNCSSRRDPNDPVPSRAQTDTSNVETESTSSSTCCGCPCPFRRSQSMALDNIPLNPLPSNSRDEREKDCELMVRRGGRPPLLPSKTVVVPPSSTFLSGFNLDKSSSIACLQDARFICKEKLLRTFPNKLTSSGVRILYLCDARASNNKTELDDGAYNPLWTMRGFTQTFHMWRESRRAQSVPLNAFLTYITLPCTSIMKDVLEHRDEPSYQVCLCLFWLHKSCHFKLKSLRTKKVMQSLLSMSLKYNIQD
ncbi:unnamed protein product [Allacma fusca]|uniref:Uncharacterized protein n=1 Tax=Allacma fusca TaxID=39272 RepID=A0A8J2JHU3_9HEXA|nr:unnamed protein product [Allacma fusca]